MTKTQRLDEQAVDEIIGRNPRAFGLQKHKSGTDSGCGKTVVPATPISPFCK